MNVVYIDCNKVAAFITSTESLSPSIMILDNLNALCPSISNDEQFNMIESVKAEKMTKLLV
jgi:hypothetical protein